MNLMSWGRCGILAAALVVLVGCGATSEGPEGLDLSYNPDQYQLYRPEQAAYAVQTYDYPNGWVRLSHATGFRADTETARQQTFQDALRLFERAAEIARERKQDYVALIQARAIPVDLVARDQLGFERERRPSKMVSDILVAFRNTPGRGWVKAIEFVGSARRGDFAGWERK